MQQAVRLAHRVSDGQLDGQAVFIHIEDGTAEQPEGGARMGFTRQSQPGVFIQNRHTH